MLVSFGRFCVPIRGSIAGVHLKSQHVRCSSAVASRDGVPQLLHKTYNQLIEEQLKKYPHKNFIRAVSENIEWTFDQTSKNQNSLASGITESGNRGCFASALALKSEHFIAQIAAARANIPFAVVEPGSKAEALEKQLKTLNPGVFLWPAKVKDTVQIDEIHKVLPRILKYHRSIPINDVRFPNLRFVIQVSRQNLEGMVRLKDFLVSDNPHPLKQADRVVNPTSPHVILLTPEFDELTLSQNNIINTGYFVGHKAGLNEEDSVLTTLQLHHAAGLSLGMGLGVSCKVELVIAAEVFDPEAILKALNDESVTVLIAQPNEFHDLLSHQVKKKSPTLKKIIVVSSPGNLSSPQLIGQLKEIFGVSVFVTFGTDETSGVISFSQDSTDGNVGKPLPHSEVKIVDASGKMVPVNTTGELLVKGFNVTAGYRNNPQLTQKILKDGYYHSGISAKLDNNNNLHVV